MKIIETALLLPLFGLPKQLPGLFPQALQHLAPLPRLVVHGALAIAQLFEAAQFGLKGFSLGEEYVAAGQLKVQPNGRRTVAEFILADTLPPVEFGCDLCNPIPGLLDSRLHGQQQALLA